jgi:hypothetical protein
MMGYGFGSGSEDVLESCEQHLPEQMSDSCVRSFANYRLRLLLHCSIT